MSNWTTEVPQTPGFYWVTGYDEGEYIYIAERKDPGSPWVDPDRPWLILGSEEEYSDKEISDTYNGFVPKFQPAIPCKE